MLKKRIMHNMPLASALSLVQEQLLAGSTEVSIDPDGTGMYSVGYNPPPAPWEKAYAEFMAGPDVTMDMKYVFKAGFEAGSGVWSC